MVLRSEQQFSFFVVLMDCVLVLRSDFPRCCFPSRFPDPPLSSFQLAFHSDHLLSFVLRIPKGSGFLRILMDSQGFLWILHKFLRISIEFLRVPHECLWGS